MFISLLKVFRRKNNVCCSGVWMDIFVDVVAAVTKKTVNKRNKMLHVNAEKKHVLSGDRCGVYMNKYIELYSTIVLQQIKM